MSSARAGRIEHVLDVLRAMPAGVRVVLAFGFVLLGGLGLTLPLVISQAIEAPVSPLGLLYMLLLAYLVFTLTLILQRKEAAWMLSLGLVSLSVPLAVILWFWGGALPLLAGLVLAALLFWSLRGERVRGWFNEP